ncbi:hypothetical protein NUSPORA_00762 [Nucleospora cyclopteri]
MKRKTSTVCLSANISWTIQKGSWIMHPLLTFAIYLLTSYFFTSNYSLQLTLVSYNMITFIFFHWIVGDPFDKNNREFTFWEQVTEQIEAPSTLIYMSLFPVVLFMFVNRIVDWNIKMYILSVISLLLVTIPKLSFMHMKRLFGVRRYD